MCFSFTDGKIGKDPRAHISSTNRLSRRWGRPGNLHGSIVNWVPQRTTTSVCKTLSPPNQLALNQGSTYLQKWKNVYIDTRMHKYLPTSMYTFLFEKTSSLFWVWWGGGYRNERGFWCVCVCLNHILHSFRHTKSS